MWISLADKLIAWAFFFFFFFEGEGQMKTSLEMAVCP